MIGLVGLPGTGKGECARIARNQGYHVVSMGDLVREHTKNQGLEMTDENIGSNAHAERERFGYDIWAKRTVQKIIQLNLPPSGVVIIDGIRGDAEVKIFLDSFAGAFKTVAVLMNDKKRFELLQKRNRSDAPVSWGEFKARDTRESRWGIHRAIKNADYIIFNNGTIEELEDGFKELLSLIQQQEQ